MDSDSSSRSDGCRSGDEAVHIEKSEKCTQCGEDFEDVDYDNRPVMNPCGCTFHWYCRHKYSHYTRNSGVSCPGCGKCACDEYKKSHKEVQKLKSKNAELKLKLAAAEKTIETLSKQQVK